jgi:uncharacterized protein
VTDMRVAPDVVEAFVPFACGEASLIGVLARPAATPAAALGVVIVVGGPQYRAGSHRQFTLLARDLARAGFAVLRFDCRGMGDSDGDPRDFADIAGDLEAAIDTMVREAGVARVALWGLCDGASAAFMYAGGDPRVAGVVAVNPWVRTEATLASTRLRHYYVRRLLAPAFWRNLARGRLRLRESLSDLATSVRAAGATPGDDAPAFLRRMHDGWRRLARPPILILSGRDLTAREFEAWAGADRERAAWLAAARVHAVPEADHTFSSRAARAALTRATLDGLAPLCQAS